MNEVYWGKNIKFGTSEISLRDKVLISEEDAISLHSKKRQNARKNYYASDIDKSILLIWLPIVNFM